MRCIHCGAQIGDTDRFCSLCGRENIPMASVQRPMPRQPQYAPPAGAAPAQPKQDKGDVLKWVLLGVWLAVVAALWILLLVSNSGGSEAHAEEEPGYEAYREPYFVTLTEGSWYCWDAASSALYCWEFDDDGTAEYGIAGKKDTTTVDYTIGEDSNTVFIGYSDDPVVWHYDPVEGCFWEYCENQGQITRIRIFPARDVPDGTMAQYTYRTDNGNAYFPVTFPNVTEMSKAVAEDLIGHYNNYINFGVCGVGEADSQAEAQRALDAVGPDDWHTLDYGVGKVPCCQTLGDMHSHLYHMFSDDLIGSLSVWEGNPAAYDGRIYYFVPPMGYGGYYLTGDVTDHGDGTWTVPVGVYMEDDLSCTATFAMVDGTIKLVSIKRDSQQPQPGQEEWELTRDQAWQLLDRTDFGWMLYYFSPDGTVDYSDTYIYCPDPSNPEFTVECPSVKGVDTADDLRRMLQRHFTDAYIDQYFMRSSYYCAQRNTNIFGGSWFSANGTIYFEPNWGAGYPMLLENTMQITYMGELYWKVTIEREFYTEPETFYVTWEGGTHKRDT